MATTIAAEKDSANLDGMSEAFAGLAEALIEDTDGLDEDSIPAEEFEETEEIDPTPEEIAEIEQAEPDAEAVQETVEQPFTYTVDGQAKAYNADVRGVAHGGITMRIGADGKPESATVAKNAIPDLQYRLQRGDYLEGQNTHLYGQVKQFEAVGGMQKVQDMAVENARLKEAAAIMADTLENPEKLVALAYAIQNGDMGALQLLGRELKVAAQDAAQRTQSEFTTNMQQQLQTQDEPTLIANTIGQSVTQWATRYPNLTREDLQSAYAQLQSFGSAVVWKASPEEARQAGVRPGEHIIDHRKVDAYLKQVSTYKGEQAKTAHAVTAAAKENAARRPVPTITPKKPLPKKPTKATESESGEETWSQQKARMESGRFAEND